MGSCAVCGNSERRRPWVLVEYAGPKGEAIAREVCDPCHQRPPAGTKGHFFPASQAAEAVRRAGSIVGPPPGGPPNRTRFEIQLHAHSNVDAALAQELFTEAVSLAFGAVGGRLMAVTDTRGRSGARVTGVVIVPGVGHDAELLRAALDQQGIAALQDDRRLIIDRFEEYDEAA